MTSKKMTTEVADLTGKPDGFDNHEKGTEGWGDDMAMFRGQRKERKTFTPGEKKINLPIQVFKPEIKKEKMFAAGMRAEVGKAGGLSKMIATMDITTGYRTQLQLVGFLMKLKFTEPFVVKDKRTPIDGFFESYVCTALKNNIHCGLAQFLLKYELASAGGTGFTEYLTCNNGKCFTNILAPIDAMVFGLVEGELCVQLAFALPGMNAAQQAAQSEAYLTIYSVLISEIWKEMIHEIKSTPIRERGRFSIVHDLKDLLPFALLSGNVSMIRWCVYASFGFAVDLMDLVGTPKYMKKFGFSECDADNLTIKMGEMEFVMPVVMHNQLTAKPYIFEKFRYLKTRIPKYRPEWDQGLSALSSVAGSVASLSLNGSAEGDSPSVETLLGSNESGRDVNDA